MKHLFPLTALLLTPLAAMHAGETSKPNVVFLLADAGGKPTTRGAATLNGGSQGTLTAPSTDDWLAVIVKESVSAR